jgi:hypothetical protein
MPLTLRYYFVIFFIPGRDCASEATFRIVPGNVHPFEEADYETEVRD